MQKFKESSLVAISRIPYKTILPVLSSLSIIFRARYPGEKVLPTYLTGDDGVEEGSNLTTITIRKTVCFAAAAARKNLLFNKPPGVNFEH